MNPTTFNLMVDKTRSEMFLNELNSKIYNDLILTITSITAERQSQEFCEGRSEGHTAATTTHQDPP